MNSKYLFGLVFVLVLSLATHEAAMAKMCEKASSTFKGVCLSDTNCQSVCSNEGFVDGECEGFRHRCICRNPCN
ncbi:defensin-like protein 5 [Phtheirospermum japonicum]|uniref:Defensin-like protein 5 n=1 Tax=Phtheirospermum japonicum TaxID=374723 RepID=A0A830CG86_9LAMI|nr:defensin-like protein 5 [Phtheirospermum japonicum]